MVRFAHRVRTSMVDRGTFTQTRKVCRTKAEALFVQVSMPMLGQAALGSLPTELSCTEAGGVLLRAGLKRFFFDTFQNPNGSFFRITEVWSCPLRTS